MKEKIAQVCDSLKAMLIAKNESYGNSALEPVRIFSKADNVEQIRVRIDDKLSRIAKGQAYPGDNDIDDLLGYFVLLKIANAENDMARKLMDVIPKITPETGGLKDWEKMQLKLSDYAQSK